MKTLLAFILLSSFCFGQSKKDQIKRLNHTIDSLNIILKTSRDNSAKIISSFNVKIKEITDEVTILKNDLTNLQTLNNELSTKNIEFQSKIDEMIRIDMADGSLEVLTYDLGQRNWEDAMKVCANLGDGWRLPTKDELIMLYTDLQYLDDYTYYWSSTEGIYDSAWCLLTRDGSMTPTPKQNTLRVRPVRSSNE